MTELPPPRLDQRHAPTDVPRPAGRVPGVRPTSRSTRRRHPARGARIAATGLGLTTMFGLVAAMGIAAVDTTSDTAPPSDATNLDAAPATVPTPSTATAPAPAAPAPTAPAPAAPAAGPTVMTARPDVRVITPQAPTAPAPAPAPAATTRGSS